MVAAINYSIQASNTQSSFSVFHLSPSPLSFSFFLISLPSPSSFSLYSLLSNNILLSPQARLSFDTCWLENIGERIVLETVGNRVTPLVINPGRVLLTNERLYFQVGASAALVLLWPLAIGDSVYLVSL